MACPQNPNIKVFSEADQTPREVRVTALADSARWFGASASFDFNPSSQYMETMVAQVMSHVDRFPVQNCGSVYVLSITTITSPSLLSLKRARNSVAVMSGPTDMPNISDSIFNFRIMMFPMERRFDSEMVPRPPLHIANGLPDFA